MTKPQEFQQNLRKLMADPRAKTFCLMHQDHSVEASLVVRGMKEPEKSALFQKARCVLAALVREAIEQQEDDPNCDK